MSYYNWKTGRWATYNQCRQTSIVAASQELTLEKYRSEKIEEEALPQNRTKRMFEGYMRFENRIYGQMLGKGHHQFAAALVKWLLRASIVGTCFALLYGLFYAIYMLMMLVFKFFLIAIAVFFVIAFVIALVARVVFVF